MRLLADSGLSFFIANSFSKSMSLYGERAGALSVVCASAAEAELVMGQMKATVRRNYSSPAVHAAGVVSRVLGTPALRASWEAPKAADIAQALLDLPTERRMQAAKALDAFY